MLHSSYTIALFKILNANKNSKWSPGITEVLLLYVLQSLLNSNLLKLQQDVSGTGGLTVFNKSSHNPEPSRSLTLPVGLTRTNFLSLAQRERI